MLLQKCSKSLAVKELRSKLPPFSSKSLPSQPKACIIDRNDFSPSFKGFGLTIWGLIH